MLTNTGSDVVFLLHTVSARVFKAMSVSKKHVLGFSPNGGKLFALVDDQGILRIWDTETNTQKQEFTANLHASGPCTALTWVTVGVSRPKKSRNSTDNNKLYLALGTLKGNVALYSVAEGKVCNCETLTSLL